MMVQAMRRGESVRSVARRFVVSPEPSADPSLVTPLTNGSATFLRHRAGLHGRRRVTVLRTWSCRCRMSLVGALRHWRLAVVDPPAWTGSAAPLIDPPAFILATRQDEIQGASRDAPIAPGSPKVAPRAGLPSSARIPNHVLPAGLGHRQSLFQQKTSRARFDRAGAANFLFARATPAHANCRPQPSGKTAQ
jgi:hypothetical protein